MTTSHSESQPPIADLYNPVIYTASALALDGLLKLMGNYEIEVWDKLPDDQAGILAPKHSGVLDIPLLGAATRQVYDRNIRFIYKKELAQDYPGSNKTRRYFDLMGGIILDQSKKMKDQPAGPQVQRDINNNQVLGVFTEGGVNRGRGIPTKRRHGIDVPKTLGIGPLAINTLAPVQVVGMAGSEGTLRDWLGPKYVVYGKILVPERDEAVYDPDNPRTWLRDARAYSREVDANMQAANDRAHQLHSRTTVSMSGRRR